MKSKECFRSKVIPFNKPALIKDNGTLINFNFRNHFSGNGHFSIKCQEYLKTEINCNNPLLTHSCTGALEMSALLLDIKVGDEIIMPSYTFVSTANAFALRGGVPVFLDIRTDTLNIDEKQIEDAITPKTKAIVVVHYAGVSCEMKTIMGIANKHSIPVIEDSAQGIMAKYNGTPLGSIGTFGCLSFHETKNIHCGEGGAILINDNRYVERAEIIREKGTNRSQFFRGQVDKYRWVDIGSSYLPGEVTAAFLATQLECAEEITQKRLDIWKKYHEFFEDLENSEKVRRPIIPRECNHNGHIYYLLINKEYNRGRVLQKMNELGVNAVFHYQPLHSSPAGKKYGKHSFPLPVTDEISERIIRLPLWIGFDQHERVFDALNSSLLN
jgi:dTDP-4-amino-4,6-dideoxygalactose transaminase